MTLRIAVIPSVDAIRSSYPEIAAHLEDLEKESRIELERIMVDRDIPLSPDVLSDFDAVIARQRGCPKIEVEHIGGQRVDRPFHAVSLSRGADRFMGVSGCEGARIWRYEGNGKGNLEGTAQLAVLLAQLLLRPIHKAFAAMQSGNFKVEEFERAHLIEGKRWVLFGAGNIACRMLPKILTLLPREIVIINRNMDPSRLVRTLASIPGQSRLSEKEVERHSHNGIAYYETSVQGFDSRQPTPITGVHLESFEGFKPIDRWLSQADILSVHIDGIRDTVFTKEFFALLKKGAYFINISRAHLVDEEALVDSLISGELSGAASDVFSEETEVNCQPSSSPLWKAATTNGDEVGCGMNILLTPHIGGDTVLDRLRVSIRPFNQFLNAVGLPQCAPPEGILELLELEE